MLDADGNTVRLSDMFGKPVVINFWATWCPPCKRELPDFDRLCREYGDRVVFMMVNLTDGRRDTVDGTKKFVSEKGYTFPVYFEPASAELRPTVFRLSRRRPLLTRTGMSLQRASVQ